MPHNESVNLEGLFYAWLAGESLSKEQLNQLKNDSEWAERMQVAENMKFHNQQFESSVKTPEWDRVSTYTRSVVNQQKGWLQTTLVPSLAMTFSVFACVVMLFDINLVKQEGQWQVLTGSDYREQWQQEQQAAITTQINHQLDQKLNDWYVQSSAHITNTFDKLETRQAENTTRLANYLLESSRAERQQDIQRVVHLLQSQQSEDLAYLEDEINRLQYQFRSANESRPSLSTSPVPYAVSDE